MLKLLKLSIMRDTTIAKYPLLRLFNANVHKSNKNFEELEDHIKELEAINSQLYDRISNLERVMNMGEWSK